MDRYTAKDKMMGWQLRANITVRGDCAAYNKAMERLAAYEDTGLLPSEVVTMREGLEAVEKVLGWMCLQCGYEPGWQECVKCPVREWRYRDGDVMSHSEIIKLAHGAETPALDHLGEVTAMVAPDTAIPATANRVLTLQEVLARPEGARVWVEDKHFKSCTHTVRHNYTDSAEYNGDGQTYEFALVDDCHKFYENPQEGDGAYMIQFRVWSLPVAPTEDELRGNPWGKEEG